MEKNLWEFHQAQSNRCAWDCCSLLFKPRSGFQEPTISCQHESIRTMWLPLANLDNLTSLTTLWQFKKIAMVWMAYLTSMIYLFKGVFSRYDYDNLPKVIDHIYYKSELYYVILCYMMLWVVNKLCSLMGARFKRMDCTWFNQVTTKYKVLSKITGMVVNQPTLRFQFTLQIWLVYFKANLEAF